MHLAALSLGLALSFVERRENNKVVNYWAPFRDLYKKAEKLATAVFGTKNKTQYDDYKKTLKAKGMDVIHCRLPNKTRVAGCHLLMTDLLRSKFALCYYASQEPKIASLNLSQEEWNQLAEFAAVMDRAVKLCFTS